jgi:WD40 repeat protein
VAGFSGHSGPARAVVISPDGSYLASVGDDRTVRVWDRATGEQISVYRSSPTVFLSYVRQNQPIVNRLQQLTEAGMSVWTD